MGLACATRGCFPRCPCCAWLAYCYRAQTLCSRKEPGCSVTLLGLYRGDLGVPSVSCHSKSPQTKLSLAGNLPVRRGWGRPRSVLQEARRRARALFSFSPLRFFATRCLPRALPRAALPRSLQLWPCCELLGQGGFCSALRAVGSSRETCVGKARGWVLKLDSGCLVLAAPGSSREPLPPPGAWGSCTVLPRSCSGQEMPAMICLSRQPQLTHCGERQQRGPGALLSEAQRCPSCPSRPLPQASVPEASCSAR